MLLLGLDDFGVGPAWTSSSELNVVDLRELLHAVEPTRSRRYVDGGLKFDSRAEVHMACSILDLSWRTCERARDGAANASTHLTVSDAAMRRVAQGDLDLVNGPARVLVREQLHCSTCGWCLAASVRAAAARDGCKCSPYGRGRRSQTLASACPKMRPMKHDLPCPLPSRQV